MRYLRQSTATIVEVGPFVDDTDGKTLEEGLTIASIDIQLMQPLDTAAVPPDRVANGAFASDTSWTKNSWTIAGGVADSAGAQSTDIEQTPATAFVENVAYEVVFDVATQSAGDVTAKVGGTAGTARSTVATFTETIIAGSGSLLEFTASGFTGTIDNVVVKQVPIPITPAASGTSNDMVLTQANTGTYWLELTANQVGIVGRHKLTAFISGALIVWEEFQVLEEEVYDDLFAASAVGYLKPSTAGRDLDVSAGGEAGLDWANIGSKTTVNDLTQTDIQLCDTTTAVTNQVTADTTAISGDSTAADNAELFFDGTGYAGGSTKLGVDIVSVSGDTTSADNLELDYDGTGYDKSNSTIGTATTNTDLISAATIADAIWNEARSGHATLGTYGDAFIGLVTGSAEAGTLSTTVMTSDLAEATDDHYNGRTVVWTSGVLAGQASDITDYLGSTGQLTYTAVTEAPGAGDDFVIY